MWDNYGMLDLLSSSLRVVAALIAAYLIWQWALNLPIFPLKEVNVSGSDRSGALDHVTREQINDVVRSEVRGGFFTVDLKAVGDAFTKLPWVRTARVRRAWPQSVQVTLEEHVALARWGSSASVNVYGEIFNVASDEKLPLFEGLADSSLEMARQYAVFNELLRPLHQRVEQISVSPRRAWRLRLKNGRVLELGREQMEARLERYVLAHDRSIAKLDQQLSYVDLRYPNGFAAR